MVLSSELQTFSSGAKWVQLGRCNWRRSVGVRHWLQLLRTLRVLTRAHHHPASQHPSSYPSSIHTHTHISMYPPHAHTNISTEPYTHHMHIPSLYHILLGFHARSNHFWAFLRETQYKGRFVQNSHIFPFFWQTSLRFLLYFFFKSASGNGYIGYLRSSRFCCNATRVSSLKLEVNLICKNAQNIPKGAFFAFEPFNLLNGI